MRIYAKGENAQLEEIENQFELLGLYSKTKIPDSRIEICSQPGAIALWAAEQMKIRSGDIIYFFKFGMWAGIRILNAVEAVHELLDLGSILAMSEKMDRLTEVSADSRDEHCYLFDEYFILQDSTD